MTPPMRAKRKQLAGRAHSLANNANRGAMAPGGPGRGQDGNEHSELSGSRKRKRGKTGSDAEDDEGMAFDESNGKDGVITDERHPELGMFYFDILI
jgi:hypothetical protein